MSSFVSEPVRTDERPFATSRHGNWKNLHGQGHDRIPEHMETRKSVAMNEASDEPDFEMDISAAQKIFSAVSGSLLTSLLGMTTSYSM